MPLPFAALAGWMLIIGLIAALTACGERHATEPGARQSSASDAKALNLFIWPDYLAPETLADFERKTGIRTKVLVFDTNETLETKLLAGNSGFDVVFPSAPYFERQIAAGVYHEIHPEKMPNWRNLDPRLMAMVAHNDGGNRHGAIYLSGTEGIGYNEDAVRKALPDAPLDSWKLVFDPRFASKLSACGINILDNPAGVVRLVLAYLGRDPNAPTAKDLTDTEAVLLSVRPFVRTVDSFAYTQALANGDICIAVAYNGDAAQARARAAESNNGVKIAFIIPKEGSIMWFDMMAIPKDAPHLENAYAFMNYVMEAGVMARISNFTRYANANLASTSFVDASIANDPMIYPTAEQTSRLFVQQADPIERARVLTRIWQRFKTGQ